MSDVRRAGSSVGESKDSVIILRSPLMSWLHHYVVIGFLSLILAGGAAGGMFFAINKFRSFADPGPAEIIGVALGAIVVAPFCWYLCRRFLRRCWIIDDEGILAGGGGFRRRVKFEDIVLVRSDGTQVTLDVRWQRKESLVPGWNDQSFALETIASLSQKAASINILGQVALPADPEKRQEVQQAVTSESSRRKRRAIISLVVTVALLLITFFAARSASSGFRWFAFVQLLVFILLAVLLLLAGFAFQRARASHAAMIAQGRLPPMDPELDVEFPVFVLVWPRFVIVRAPRSNLEDGRAPIMGFAVRLRPNRPPD